MPKGTFTAELIALIGPEATRQMINHYGGSHLYIPKTPHDHPIADVIGEANARLLCDQFGGLRVIVPLGQRMALDRRNKAIRRDRESGLSIPALAKRHKVSIRQLYYILNGKPSEPLHPAPAAAKQQQLSLF